MDPNGSDMELRREEPIITRPGGLARRLRAGLQSEQRVPVEEIMSLSGSQALQLVASEGALIERRK
jgi:hypothetical protein